MKNYFSENLSHILKEKRYSYQYLADQIGVSKSTVRSAALANNKPNIEFLYSVSKYFDISCDDLLKTDLSEVKDLSTIANSAIKDLNLIDDFHIMDYIVKNEDRLKEENSFFRVWINQKAIELLKEEEEKLK